MDQPPPPRTLHKLKPEGTEGMGADGTPILFECEGGDLATSAAFDGFPPADVLAQLGPVTICSSCFPDEAAGAPTAGAS